jgi:branched-chain amino acid transport system substrate-binding protein
LKEVVELCDVQAIMKTKIKSRKEDFMLKSRKMKLLSIGFVVLILLVASLTWACPKPAPAESIKIGCMLDLTSYMSVPCKPEQEGIKIRIEESGFIDGRPVELIIEDTASSPDQALDKARKLVERDKVKLIIGPHGATPAAAVAAYLAESKIPSTAIIGQTDEVASLHSLTYLPHGHNSQVGYASGVYAYEAGLRTVVTSSMDFVGGHSLMDGFAQAFVTERGGKIIQQQWVPPTATDYSSYILGMEEADAAVVFFVGTAVVPFFSQYGELGKMPVVESYSELEFPELIGELGTIPAEIPVVSSLTWIYTDPSPESQAFVSKYEQKYGHRPAHFALLGYSAASIMLDALQRAGADASQEELIKALDETDLQLPEGRIKFNEDHIGIANVRFVGYVEKDGQIEFTEEARYQVLSELAPGGEFKITLAD